MVVSPGEEIGCFLIAAIGTFRNDLFNLLWGSFVYGWRKMSLFLPCGRMA